MKLCVFVFYPWRLIIVNMSKLNFFPKNFFSFKATLIRFPSTLGICLLAAVLAIYLADAKEVSQILLKLLFSTALVIPFSIALALLIESYKKRYQQIYTFLGVSAFLILHFFLTKSDQTLNYTYQLLHLFVLFHLVVSFAPFMYKGKDDSFWHFNRIIFTRLIIAIFYAATVFLSLSLLCSLASYLFDLNLKFEFYLKIFSFCLFIVQTWLFLMGVPKDFKSLANHAIYPNGLKIFLQFIFIPLILIYSFVLYVYLGKVLVNWSLPKGLTSWFVSGIGVTGMFGLLILNNKLANIRMKWIVFFERYFFHLLIPLLGLLFVALATRIQEYGVTLNRYIMFGLALWLFVLSIYYILKRNASYKLIPVSLSIILFAVYFGPWGVYQFSLRSQEKSLKEFLTNNAVLNFTQGVQKTEKKFSLFERKKISDQLVYIVERYGEKPLEDIFGVDFARNIKVSKQEKFYLFSSSYDTDTVINLMEKIGINYASPWEQEFDDNNLDYQFNLAESAVNIKGYDQYLTFNVFQKESQELGQYVFKLNLSEQKLQLWEGNILILEFPLAEKILELRKKIDDKEIHWDEKSKFNSEAEKIEIENVKFKAKLLFTNIRIYNLKEKDKKDSELFVSGAVLLKAK